MLTVDNLELAIELVKRAKLVSKEKKEQYLIDNGGVYVLQSELLGP